MRDYRVYIIGINGRFMRAIPLNCPDDGTAIESAKQFIDGHDIELWQRDCLLARFDRRPKATVGWLKGELKPSK